MPNTSLTSGKGGGKAGISTGKSGGRVTGVKKGKLPPMTEKDLSHLFGKGQDLHKLVASKEYKNMDIK